MPQTVKFYGKGMLAIVKNDVDLEADTLKLTLHTSAYVPDLDVHDFYDDTTNELATATGYTAGGVTLTSGVFTYDPTSNQVRWDCADPSWVFSASKTWRYGVLRKSRGGAASADELVALIDWSTDQTSSVPYTVAIDPLGLLYIDVT